MDNLEVGHVWYPSRYGDIYYTIITILALKRANLDRNFRSLKRTPTVYLYFDVFRIQILVRASPEVGAKYFNFFLVFYIFDINFHCKILNP